MASMITPQSPRHRLVITPGAETDDEAAAERLATMTKLLPQLLEPLLVLSLTWSVGGLCDAAGRIKFDAFLRNQLKEGGSRANLPREVRAPNEAQPRLACSTHRTL